MALNFHKIAAWLCVIATANTSFWLLPYPAIAAPESPFGAQQSDACDPSTTPAKSNKDRDACIKKKQYFLCGPWVGTTPSATEVRDCINKIRVTWEASWLPAVRGKQQYLIARQNVGSILQWTGVSGGAAAASLGIANPKNSGTTAIVLGSVSVITAISGILWKQQASNSRIASCTDVLSKQYKIQASLETWYLQANNSTFQNEFLNKVKTDFIEVVTPGLEGCMPGEWMYGA